MSMVMTRIAEHFAYAYYREELKAQGHNPDIIAQQNGKDNNPHKTKHILTQTISFWVNQDTET